MESVVDGAKRIFENGEIHEESEVDVTDRPRTSIELDLGGENVLEEIVVDGDGFDAMTLKLVHVLHPSILPYPSFSDRDHLIPSCSSS